jgi:hypothetical protein
MPEPLDDELRLFRARWERADALWDLIADDDTSALLTVHRDAARLLTIVEELRARIVALEAQVEARNAVINHWYPILGYATANEMVYPVVGDPRATPPPALK